MQQEVYTSQIWELKSIDGFALVFDSKQIDDPLSSQKAPQPVPFIVVAHKKADVAIRSLVACSTKHCVAQRYSHSLAKIGQGNRIGRFIGHLLSRIDFGDFGRWDAYRSVVSIEKVYSLVYVALREQSDPVLEEGFGQALPQVVAQ